MLNRTHRKSKLRKPIEIALGPKYTGSEVSREAAFAEDESASEEDDEKEESDVEGNPKNDSDLEDDGEEPYAELDDVDIETGAGMEDEDVDIDSDAAFGASDDERFEKFMFRGSGKPRDAGLKGKGGRPTASDFMSDSEKDDEDLEAEDSEQEETDEDVLDSNAQHSDEDFEMNSDGGASIGNAQEDQDEDEDHEDSNESQSDQGSETSLKDDDDSEDESEDEDDKARRDELRALMGSEQQTVAAISLAAKADALKGNAVRSQRKAFDQLLHTRMDLQKALIAANSLSAVDQVPIDEEVYSAAESAALKLWSSLESLRSTLSKPSSSKSASKRKHSEVSASTPSQELWDRMQSHEISMLDNRQQVLDKWSSKVRGTDSQPITRKLGQSSTSQALSSLLRDQLSSSDHLVQKSRIPRSCAPLQRTANIPSSSEIYDDGPFYQLLLKELVDQRRVETLSNGGGEVLGWTAVKDVKQRKQVDTKASKGRKMRYNVHEKLQNYMAPEDRGSWEEDAVGRFFGTLLGQKMSLVEEDGDGEEEAGDGQVEAEEEGLRLFRS